MYCVMKVQWNVHRKSSFACTKKGGWPGQMRFKMAGKFKTTTNFLHYKPANNGHNALASEYIRGHSSSTKFSSEVQYVSDWSDCRSPLCVGPCVWSKLDAVTFNLKNSSKMVK